VTTQDIADPGPASSPSTADSAVQRLRAWPLKRRCETIARFWGLHWSAIQLVILRDHGGDDLARFKYQILRTHQRSHFLEGVDKLGIDRSLPPAVIAGRYHYFSNAIGGLTMEYIEESPRKVWIRYLPPAWSFPGQSLFAVPPAVERAMFAGWHPFNGESLGCLRLGFVVTKVYQEGEPYDEGYFQEFERDLAPDERLRFQPVTASPDFDPERAPNLDPAAWPEDRLTKARRNFALGYVQDAVATAVSIYGHNHAAELIASAARLVAIQFLGEFKAAFGVVGAGARDLVDLVACLGELASESIKVETAGPGRFALRRQNRVLTPGAYPETVARALGAFIATGARVLSPRVGAVLREVDSATGLEVWTIEDSADRLF
jgi:hypothetical protein